MCYASFRRVSTRLRSSCRPLRRRDSPRPFRWAAPSNRTSRCRPREWRSRSTVVTATPLPLANAAVGLNIRQPEVEALATSRTLQGIATLSPGVNENTPNAAQLSISGAFAFDNLFMVNGVDVNDNMFGAPQNLFIEDAIEETQVLTSGISAEYRPLLGRRGQRHHQEWRQHLLRQLPCQPHQSVVDRRNPVRGRQRRRTRRAT